MLDYFLSKDKDGKLCLKTSLTGKTLLTIPALNKGTAFSERERQEFGLIGKLPDRIESLEEQITRVYEQYKSYDKPKNRNRYLNRLLEYSQTLFYALVKRHTEEMLPIIYTPFVGINVKLYNMRFMQPRGLYISYNNQDRIEEILNNRTNHDIKLIVVTDGEAILGIGDQGVGGMAIPVAKLMVYSLFGCIDPNTTLPIMLDVGTNNQEILDDPLYLGYRHTRISGEKYRIFMDKFIKAIQKKFPHVFLHFEDFGRANADYYLQKYRNQLCCFNDDIQGTGVVALAAVIASGKKTHTPLQQQRIVVFGAGSAGMGVTENIYQAMCQMGLTKQEAKQLFWIIDRTGLVTEYLSDITEAQSQFCREKSEINNWKVQDKSHITLLEVIQNVKPTILIGCSAQPGAFTQEIVTEMAQHIEYPTILPLSNPNERAEATPEDIIHWTQGSVLIATGSPFNPVEYNGQTYIISQCNNYLAFPGIGLGVIAIRAKKITNTMLNAASEALAQYATQNCQGLLPDINQVEAASTQIAIAIAKAGINEGLHSISIDKPLEEIIAEIKWTPEYIPYYANSN